MFSQPEKSVDGEIVDAALVYQAYAILLESDSDVMLDWTDAVEKMFEPGSDEERAAFHAQFTHVNVYVSHPSAPPDIGC